MSSEFRADLHCHSIFSDGELHPNELLKLAKRVGLSAISVTDHDTIEAYNEEFFEEAKRLGISILTGVEISSAKDGVSIHILAYGFDYRSEELKRLLQSIQKNRMERNLEILRRLAKRGIIIDEGELFSKKGVVGRPEIARIMIEKGYVGDIRTAFLKYLKDGASCFYLGRKYEVSYLIERVHMIGAKAVLAHPDKVKKEVLLKLLGEKFDGVEVDTLGVYRLFGDDILKVFGSDFHGRITKAELGSFYTSLDVFLKLKGEYGKAS